MVIMNGSIWKFYYKCMCICNINERKAFLCVIRERHSTIDLNINYKLSLLPLLITEGYKFNLRLIFINTFVLHSILRLLPFTVVRYNERSVSSESMIHCYAKCNLNSTFSFSSWHTPNELITKIKDRREEKKKNTAWVTEIFIKFRYYIS